MWRNDPALLFPLASLTSEGDRHWLAELFTFIRGRHDPYRYLEVGSYLGGTLTPALLDERCQKVLSIDLRPSTQPDARQAVFDCRHASTAAMRETLKKHPELDVSKLATFDGAVADCKFGNDLYELAFIDAEHTDEAAFADFLALYPHLAKGAVCAFHDSNLITAGLENIQTFLRFLGRTNWFAAFGQSSVSAIFLDTESQAVPVNLRMSVWNWKDFKDKSRDALLLEVVRHRCTFNVVLREKPILPQ